MRNMTSGTIRKPQPVVRSILFCLGLGFAATPVALPGAPTHIPANDPNIQYIGRFDHSNPVVVTFDWSYSCISARFQGTSCAVQLGNTSKFFEVYIDGARASPIIRTNQGVESLPVAVGLPDGVHTVTIYRRDEAGKGVNTFRGFLLDSGKSLVAPEARPLRKVGFIGDSFTCGYGNEAPYGGSFSYATENADLTYAARMARHYNADCMMIAWSGKGMVRNYGAAGQTSPDPLPYYYSRICGTVAADNYAFAWQPDVVVVALGINDFSTSPNPTPAQYCGGYSNFVRTIRGHYPNADILCTYLSSMAGVASGYIQSVVNSLDDPKVHFARVIYTLAAPADLGAAGHPNALGHTKIANALIPVFNSLLGTNWGSAPHGTPLAWLRAHGFTNDFAAAEESDPDDDGVVTWQEYRAGTNPTNAASVFRLQAVTPTASGLRLTWYGTTNSGVTTPFQIDRTTNLFPPVWTPIISGIPRAGDGMNAWTDAAPVLNAPNFYRVVIPPP